MVPGHRAAAKPPHPLSTTPGPDTHTQTDRTSRSLRQHTGPAPRGGREEAASRQVHTGSQADTEEAVINSKRVERPLRAAIETVVAVVRHRTEPHKHLTLMCTACGIQAILLLCR